jgi:hypothetical protein
MFEWFRSDGDVVKFLKRYKGYAAFARALAKHRAVQAAVRQDRDTWLTMVLDTPALCPALGTLILSGLVAGASVTSLDVSMADRLLAKMQSSLGTSRFGSGSPSCSCSTPVSSSPPRIEPLRPFGGRY